VLNALKARSDSKGVPGQFTWDALSNMMRNFSGTSIDYETFKAQFDTVPQIKNVVDRFDGQGLVLKTKEKPEATRSDKNNTSLDQAASRAAAATLKQPG
jgi:hypothetical protein